MALSYCEPLCRGFFTLGAPPGAHCLLKMPRQKFQTTHKKLHQEKYMNATKVGHCPGTEYTLADALRDYQELMANYEATQLMHKQLGPQWKCCD